MKILLTLPIIICFIKICSTANTCSQLQCSTMINSSNINDYAQCSSTFVCSFPNGFTKYRNSSGTQQFAICLCLQEFQISIGPNVIQSLQQIPYSIYVETNSLMILQNYTLEDDQKIIFKADDFIQMQNLTFLSGSLVWLEASNIIMNGTTIKNVSSIQTDCSCYDQTSVCDPSTWDFNFPSLWIPQGSQSSDQFNISIFSQNITFQDIKYNTIIIYATTGVNIQQSNLISSIIGIFSQNISITNKSLISTTGNGFASAQGYGCGYFDQILNQLLGCTGSGGSYGGFGGNSWPDNCNLMISRTPYALNSYPTIPGSGGGFFLPQIKDSSSGGGIINIQAPNIDIWQSKIQSNGKQGAQGGGGGSGGSIALDYYAIQGDLSTSITANGGSGKSSGGGGRIWLWNHNWKYQIYKKNSSRFVITAQGGSGCLQQLSCGQNGSITTSPCQPGYQLNLSNFICQNCTVGYYQSQYGYTQCQPCRNRPANSQYVSPQTNVSDMFINSCQYVCDKDYIRVNGLCISNFTKIINTVGGIYILISLGIIICCIIGYLIVILVQRLTEKELFNKRRQKQHYERRMLFRIQDIPYHQKRIYFSGENVPNKPWHIPQQTKQSHRKYAFPPITKLDAIIVKLIKQINSLAKYSKVHSILMIILKFYYYPLSRYIEHIYRIQKSQAIEKLVIQTNKKIPQSQSLGIKFHVYPNCSIGCLQIFNYTKSALDFYIQDYFPIYFRLQKMPLGGYSIDLNDPLMKAFIKQIDHKEKKVSENGEALHKVYQNYIIELDQLLRNTSQLVPILNHLWMMTQYNPLIQVYLYQPGQEGRIIGIEPNYSINKYIPLFLVFSSQNINKHHFISEQPLQNIYHHKVEYFNNQYKFRQQVTQEDKKSVFWQIENTINQRILSWSLGVITILILVQVVISFFIIIFIQAEKQISFTYGFIFYFVVLPFSQFISVYLSVRMILSKNCKLLSDSLYFTLGNIVKSIILIILGMIENIGDDFSNLLMSIIFYLWIMGLVCNIVSMFLKLLLHWHYSRHKAENQHENNQMEKKIN